MDADLIAALERALHCYETEQPNDETAAAIIRAHIDTLRNGGERAQIVAWLREEAAMLLMQELPTVGKSYIQMYEQVADIIERYADAISQGADAADGGNDA